MKIMTCPLNGPRNITEFVCYGEIKPPVPADANAADIGRAIYHERNIAGVVLEWWMHIPSTYVFVVERDTRTDAILRTMTVAAYEGSRQS